MSAHKGLMIWKLYACQYCDITGVTIICGTFSGESHSNAQGSAFRGMSHLLTWTKCNLSISVG